MRRLIAVGLYEATIISAGISVDLLTTITPAWVWPTVSVVCLVSAGLLYTPEIKRLVLGNRSQTTAPSPSSEVGQEERVFTERTAGELLASVIDLTEIQIERFAEPHIGKWIRVQSDVQDMSQDNSFLYVRLGVRLGLTILLQFEKGIWAARLETMSRGDTLAACGKIWKIGLLGIVLTDCEIVDVEGENESFRRSSARRPD